MSDRIYSELNIENIIMKVLVKYSPEKIKKEETLKRKIINRLKRKGHYWQDIDEVLNKYLNSWLNVFLQKAQSLKVIDSIGSNSQSVCKKVIKF